MGLFNSSTVSVDAVLTTRGKELLSTGGLGFDITQYALGDEEIDYTLYDKEHPSGTDKFGIVLENIVPLEATPTRGELKSFLHDEYDPTRRLIVPEDVTLDVNETQTIIPTEYSQIPFDTKGSVTGDESFHFTIENQNLIKFNRYYIKEDQSWESGGWFRESVTFTGKGVTVKASSVNPGGFTTVTVVGVESNLKQVIGLKINADSNATINPMNNIVDVTNPKFY